MKEIYQIAGSTFVAAVCLAATFVVYEPSLLSSAEDQFTVSASVTSELAFATPASDVTLAAIPGITGGTSNGGTQFVVRTSESNGYSMTIKASSSPALQGDAQGGSIPNYTPASAGVPDFAFSVPANTAEFGYTVEASTTADLDQSFLDDGAACNTGSSDSSGNCWLDLGTVAKTIVNRTSSTAASGATTTLKFRLTINSNPSPSIAEDTYVATTTLTATSN